MVKRKTFYVIGYKDNSGHRTTHGRFTKKATAKRELKRVLAKPKKNKSGIYMTSYRDAGAWGGVGINNPRIKKIRGYS